MLTEEDLEAICLRLGDPFEGIRTDLEELKAHPLKTETDAISYAGKILDIYETAIGRINWDLEHARQRAEALKEQYSRRKELIGSSWFSYFSYGSGTGFTLDNIDKIWTSLPVSW